MVSSYVHNRQEKDRKKTDDLKGSAWGVAARGEVAQNVFSFFLDLDWKRSFSLFNS